MKTAHEYLRQYIDEFITELEATGASSFFGRIIGRKLLEKIEAVNDPKLKDEMLEEFFCFGVDPLICPPIDPANVEKTTALLEKLAALRKAKEQIP